MIPNFRVALFVCVASASGNVRATKLGGESLELRPGAAMPALISGLAAPSSGLGPGSDPGALRMPEAKLTEHDPGRHDSGRPGRNGAPRRRAAAAGAPCSREGARLRRLAQLCSGAMAMGRTGPGERPCLHTQPAIRRRSHRNAPASVLHCHYADSDVTRALKLAHTRSTAPPLQAQNRPSWRNQIRRSRQCPNVHRARVALFPVSMPPPALPGDAEWVHRQLELCSGSAPSRYYALHLPMRSLPP